MTQIELSRASRIVRWAYLCESNVPKQTSLCALFWRVVLISPVQIATLGTLLVVVSPVLIPVYAYERWAKEPLLAWRARRDERAWERQRAKYERQVRIAAGVEPSGWRVLYEGAKAIKGKVCPLVTIRQIE